MTLHSHHAIFALPVTLALADAGAAVGATPAHYLAVGGVIVAIAAVIKGYDWAEHKVDAKVTNAIVTAFKIHGAEDETRFTALRAEIAAVAATLKTWGRRPCVSCSSARTDENTQG